MARFPKITNYIKGAVKREFSNEKEFSKAVGIPYQTLQDRWRKPGSWKLYEIAAVLRNVSFMQEEIQSITKELVGDRRL